MCPKLQWNKEKAATAANSDIVAEDEEVRMIYRQPLVLVPRCDHVVPIRMTQIVPAASKKVAVRKMSKVSENEEECDSNVSTKQRSAAGSDIPVLLNDSETPPPSAYLALEADETTL